jgi:predicted HAD superfamily Cof-like phosphohydrolase
MGFDFNKAWKIVHDSNMQKVRANSETDSKRKSSLDVVKPAGWVKPDLSECI